MPSEIKTITAKITADNSAIKRGFAETTSAARNMSGQMEGVAQRIKRAWGDLGFGRVTTRVRQLALTVGGLMGTYGLATGIRKVKDFENALGDMAIQAGKSNAWMDTARGKILETSSKWGLMKDEVASFAQTLVGYTGDADAAVKMLDKMAMAATGTGASMQALAGIVFQLGGSMKVSNGDMLKAISILRGGEQVGSMTFSNIARYGGRVIPMISQFSKANVGGSLGLKGVSAAGGLIQIAARQFSAGQEGQAATAVQTFLKQLFERRGEVAKKLGVQVEGRELVNVLKDVGRIMQDAKMATKAAKIFAEGNKVAMALGEAYGQGWNVKKGSYEAASKVFGVQGDEGRIMAQAAQRMKQPAKQWEKTMADLDNAMHTHLLPVMKELVRIMPSVAKGIKWAMDNFRLLFSAFIAFKASGAIRAMVQFVRTMAGARPGAGGGFGGVGGAGVPLGGGAPKTRLGAAVHAASYVPLVADIALGGVHAVEALNRMTGGPGVSVMPGTGGASPHEASWWKRGLGLSEEIKSGRKAAQKKAEDQIAAGMENMVAGFGISRKTIARGKAWDKLRAGGPEAIQKRLAVLRQARSAIPNEGKGLSGEAREAYRNLNTEISRLSDALKSFSEKKLNVTVKAPDGAEGRSTKRASQGVGG